MKAVKVFKIAAIIQALCWLVWAASIILLYVNPRAFVHGGFIVFSMILLILPVGPLCLIANLIALIVQYRAERKMPAKKYLAAIPLTFVITLLVWVAYVYCFVSVTGGV